MRWVPPLQDKFEITNDRRILQIGFRDSHSLEPIRKGV